MRKIEISFKSIVFTILFLISLWLLYYLKEIILVFFVALLVMTILNPIVVKLSRKKVPRGLAVILVYFILFILLGGAVAGIIPPLIEQTTNFANNLPVYLANIGIPNLISQELFREFVTQLGSLPGQVVKVGLSIVSNLVGVFTVLIFAFYLLLAREKADAQLNSIFGEDKTGRILKVLNTLELRLGGWARGELTLMFLIGLSTFIGLLILGIPYALPLAILAGVLEIIPNIGPTISAVPAVIIGFGISPVVGLAVIALYFLIQQLENYLVVPKVMEKSVGVSPIITLLALAVGFKLAGVLGIIISVPVFITLSVVLKEYFSSEIK